MQKKILIIAASLKIGGAEKVAKDMGLYGVSKGYEPHFVVFHLDEGVYEPGVLAAGGKVFHLPEPSGDYVAHIRALNALMKEHQYHAVHAHTMFNCGWAMLAAKQRNVPVRVAHAHSALDDGNGLVKRIYEEVMRKIILLCATDLVACGEKAGVRLFGEKAYRQRGKLILNGVDVETFRYNEERRNAIRLQYGWEESFLIGHVGHLAEVKNQSFLLELMPLILEKQPNARLVMLGEGEDRRMLEEKIQQLGLSDEVWMPGNVTNVADYLSAMDVFVFPSLFEGMPLSLLEVQANGLPCVISTGVPQDVYLTDLVKPLALDADQEVWVKAVLFSRRDRSEAYAARLANMGFDLCGPMEKIYRIYGGV